MTISSDPPEAAELDVVAEADVTVLGGVDLTGDLHVSKAQMEKVEHTLWMPFNQIELKTTMPLSSCMQRHTKLPTHTSKTRT